MKEEQDKYRYQIDLDNREVKVPKREEFKEKRKVILISGFISIILIAIIFYTLPFTILSWKGLIVYASIVSLAIFLFILLIRYFTILFLAYFYITKYTVKKHGKYSPFVSIIVPVYNEGILLKNSIESLLKLDYKNYEIIIVNDGSTDDSKEVAESLVGYQNGVHNKIKISLINKLNNGKAKALNAGIQYSDAEFILCMDGDSILSPATLKNSIRHFADQNVGAVAGNVKIQNRRKWLTDLQALE